MTRGSAKAPGPCTKKGPSILTMPRPFPRSRIISGQGRRWQETTGIRRLLTELPLLFVRPRNFSTPAKGCSAGGSPPAEVGYVPAPGGGAPRYRRPGADTRGWLAAAVAAERLNRITDDHRDVFKCRVRNSCSRDCAVECGRERWRLQMCFEPRRFRPASSGIWRGHSAPDLHPVQRGRSGRAD